MPCMRIFCCSFPLWDVLPRTVASHTNRSDHATRHKWIGFAVFHYPHKRWSCLFDQWFMHPEQSNQEKNLFTPSNFLISLENSSTISFLINLIYWCNIIPLNLMRRIKTLAPLSLYLVRLNTNVCQWVWIVHQILLRKWWSLSSGMSKI